YLREGRYEQAEGKLKRAVRQDPRYADAHAALAYVYSRQGDPDEALAQYRKALRLKGDDARIRNTYAVFLCGQGHYDEAMAEFRKAVENHGNKSREIALANAGVCERRHGHLQAAEEYFRQALATNARYA